MEEMKKVEKIFMAWKFFNKDTKDFNFVKELLSEILYKIEEKEYKGENMEFIEVTKQESDSINAYFNDLSFKDRNIDSLYGYPLKIKYEV